MRGAPRNGEIRRLSPVADVRSLKRMVQEYLRSVGHKGSKVGDTPIWVRYAMSKGTIFSPSHPVPVAVGPTRESVDVSEASAKERMLLGRGREESAENKFKNPLDS